MNKRIALYKTNPARWANDEDKAITYEFDFKGTLVKPGMQFKLKNDRNTYIFICLVHAISLDKTWIECSSLEGFKSARIDKISRILVPKRSYKKRV